MISPDEYICSLKMPAMLTDLSGKIISANAAMKRLEPIRYCKETFRHPGCVSGECPGAAVTLCTGIGNRRMLVLYRGDTAICCLPRILARRLPAASEGSLPPLIKAAAAAVTKMLSDPGTSPGNLFGEAAYQAFSGLYARKILTVHDYCRFLSLSTAVLFGSSRAEYYEGVGTGITLASPESAFSAAGEMIDALSVSPGSGWRVFAGNGSLTLTGGTKHLCAGEYRAVPRTHTRQFSRTRSDALVSAASAAAEFAFFREPDAASPAGLMSDGGGEDGEAEEYP